MVSPDRRALANFELSHFGLLLISQLGRRACERELGRVTARSGAVKVQVQVGRSLLAPRSSFRFSRPNKFRPARRSPLVYVDALANQIARSACCAFCKIGSNYSSSSGFSHSDIAARLASPREVREATAKTNTHVFRSYQHNSFYLSATKY